MGRLLLQFDKFMFNSDIIGRTSDTNVNIWEPGKKPATQPHLDAVADLFSRFAFTNRFYS